MSQKIGGLLLCVGILAGLALFLPNKTPQEVHPEIPELKDSTSSRFKHKRQSKAKETPYDITELNGQLCEGEIPPDFNFKDKLCISGEGSYYLIDMDGNLVRWGTNWDNMDPGWPYAVSPPQPFRMRNILVPQAKKMVFAFRNTLVLTETGDLWGWGPYGQLLLRAQSEEPVESNQPQKFLTSVKDIAAGDFYAAAVMNDHTLCIWGKQDGWQEPVTIREQVQSVHVTREILYFIDLDANLYYFPNGWSENMDGFWEEPILLDTEIEDMQFLNYEGILLLKTDGTVGIPHYRESSSTFQALAHDAKQINASGYLTENGDYWRIYTQDGRFLRKELEPDTVYAVYAIQGDSLRILRNGKIEVGFSDREDSVINTLSWGAGYPEQPAPGT